MSRSHLNAELRLVAEITAFFKKAAEEREDAIAECLALRENERRLLAELDILRNNRDVS